jgi:hypothetical protein
MRPDDRMRAHPEHEHDGTEHQHDGDLAVSVERARMRRIAARNDCSLTDANCSRQRSRA